MLHVPAKMCGGGYCQVGGGFWDVSCRLACPVTSPVAWIKGESRQEEADRWRDASAQTAAGQEYSGSTSRATRPSDGGRSREKLKLPTGPFVGSRCRGRWKGEGQGHHKVSNGLSVLGHQGEFRVCVSISFQTPLPRVKSGRLLPESGESCRHYINVLVTRIISQVGKILPLNTWGCVWGQKALTYFKNPLCQENT